MKFPDKKWIKHQLRNNLTKPLRLEVLKTYVIGSYATLTHNEKSDLDIAVVIPERRRVSSLKYTDIYHSNFSHIRQKPSWNGITIDFQFYYPDEDELVEIKDKIELF